MIKNSKAIAFLLVLMLIAAFPAAAFAATETGDISGGSTVENVLIRVVVPTNLNFALDPLGLNVTGNSQVVTADYFFVNQTFAPVKVKLDLTATLTNDAELVATTSAITGLDDDSVTDKLIYFGALGAEDLTGSAIVATPAGVEAITGSAAYTNYFGGDDPPAGLYPTNVSDTLVPFVPSADNTTGSAVIGFALGAAKESSTTSGALDALADDDAGVAAFQFYAQLNTYAEWEAGDIAVSGSYTLVPLRGETYNTYAGESFGLNQIEMASAAPEEPAPVGFIGEVDPTVKSINVASISDPQLTIAFNFGDKTLSRINMQSGTQLAADQYTVGSNNITFSTTRTTSIKGISTTMYYTIVLSDTTEYRINFIK